MKFYCSFCLANVTVFRLTEDTEVHVANIAVGHTVASALQSPTKPRRLRQVRVAQPPGHHVYVLRLLSSALGGAMPIRISAIVREDTFTPIRIDFRAETHRTFTWEPIVGAPIPLTPSPTAFDSIHVALFDEDWGTRWYAIDTLSSMRTPIASVSMSRLVELSQPDAFQKCLEHATALDCSLVRDRAAQAVKEAWK